MPVASETEGGETIARRAGLVAGLTLASRVLGLARDMVLAAVFPKAATDLFFLVFTIPNALRVLLGEGAVSAAVVPVFSEIRTKEGEPAARAYFARMLGLSAVVLLLVAVLGVIAAPGLAAVYASGYLDEPERYATTVQLTRVVFPYIFFIGLAALAMGGLNALRRFFAPAFSPLLLNVALIASAFLLVGPAQSLGLPAIGALAIGVLIGGLFQLAALVPSLHRAGLLARPRIDLAHPGVKKSLRLMVPLIAGFGVYQLNTALGRNLATFLPEGAQSYIYYGQRIVEIPQGVFAIAIATAALPTLSDLQAEGAAEKVRSVFESSLRLALFVSIPSTIALIVLAEPIVSVAFGRGEFGWTEIQQTAASLRWQAAGVWAIASVRTVVPMFFAYNDTRSPIIASAANLVFFAGCAVALMGPFDHVGIAVALSAAGLAQLVTLLWLLRRRVGRLGLTAVVRSASKATFAAAVMGGACGGAAQLVSWRGAGSDPIRVAFLVGLVVLGVGIYFALAKLLRCPELVDVIGALKRRRR